MSIRSELPTRHGVSVCVFRGDAVLMIRRGKAPGRGLWAPVGGGIEPGESAEAAALRETSEETGVTCRLLGRSGRRSLMIDEGTAAARRVELTIFAAAWVSGEPVAGDDAADARFVDLATLDALDLVAGVLPHIMAARHLFDGSRT